MLNDTLTNLVLIIGVVQGLIFVFFSLITKKIRVKGHLFLSLLVLFLSLNNFEAWLNANHINFNNYYLDHLHTPWYSMLAPLLYLFLSNYLGFSKKKYVLNISILFFISVTIIKTIFLIYSTETIESELFIQLKHFNQIAESIGFSLTIGIFYLSYKAYKRKDNAILSYKNIDDLKWLDIFFKISLVILIIWIIGLLSVVIFDINMYFFLHVGVSFLIYWIAYMGTHKHNLYSDRKSIREENKKDKIETNTIGEQTNDEDILLFNRIKKYLIKTEIYTDPLLSIESLAFELQVSNRKLSSVINHFANTSFSNYINSFRVEKAKSFLTDKSYDNYSILAIGLESGFNSKSSFFRFFKNETGVTPKIWKKNQNNIFS